MKRHKSCRKCDSVHNQNYCPKCKNPHRDLKNNNAFDDFCDISEYDPHQMLESYSYWGPSTDAACLAVQKCMSKYQTKQIYNPKTGELEMGTVGTGNFFEVDDVIKFSNKDFLSEDIVDRKFLVTKNIWGRLSIMSLDEDELAFCLSSETLIDLGAAKVGYRREKPVGFWASFRKEPEYEFVSLKDEQVQT